MPWAKIPADKLEHMPLFGYDPVKDEGDFAWYRGPEGRIYVENATSKFWFEDIADAQQAGAFAILTDGRPAEDD